MDFYSMEQFELGQADFESAMEWLAYEQDMESDPYDELEPSDADLDAMEMTWQDHLWE